AGGRLGRGEPEGQGEVDQVNGRHRHRQPAREPQPPVEHGVERLEQRQLLVLSEIELFGHKIQKVKRGRGQKGKREEGTYPFSLFPSSPFPPSVFSSRAKLYAGQGPVSSKRKPRGACSSANCSAARRNSSKRRRGTRKAKRAASSPCS